MSLQQQQAYPEAFAAFEQILAADPDHAGALYQLARTAVFAQRNEERGVACLERYLRRDHGPEEPSADAAYWRLGMLHELRGDPEAARAAYAEALALAPDESKYQQALNALPPAAGERVK
jgi:tetratricopeptide (TPR) repeat protein